MSSWTEANATQVGPSAWRLNKTTTYHVGGYPSPVGWLIVVPEGFVCDLASVPRVWQWLVDRDGLAQSAVLHDYLLELGVSRVVADACFYEASRASGVGVAQASMAYLAVSLWSVRKSLIPA